MIKYNFLLFFFLGFLINITAHNFTYANDDFFGLSSSDNTSQSQSDSENKTTLIPEIKVDTSLVTDLNKISIRVDSSAFTEKEINMFFALRQISSYLHAVNDMPTFKEKLASLLSLENYMQDHKLYRIQPTPSDIQKKIDFINTNLKTNSLKKSVEKIDPSGTLTVADVRKFFYYDSLREKFFIYLLQTDFIHKILAPRTDEKMFLYRNINKQSPAVFKKPGALYILNMTAYAPKNKSVKNTFIDHLNEEKEKILQEKNLEARKKLFQQFIKKNSVPEFVHTKVIGPLDKKLVLKDFPEYISLFDLEKGDISDPIETGSFIRYILIVDKDPDKKQKISSAKVQMQLTNILYENKAQSLFTDFLTKQLQESDVEYF